MSNFPPLRLAVLTGLADLKNRLGSLDEPDCPYDEETKTQLRDLLAPKIIETVVEKEVPVEAKNARGRPTKDVRLSDEDQQLVLTQIKNTIESLKSMGSETLATNERIQIAKTSTTLLDQLLKMMERHTTVQKMDAFKEGVIAILDDLVSEADREIFLKRIEPLR